MHDPGQGRSAARCALPPLGGRGRPLGTLARRGARVAHGIVATSCRTIPRAGPTSTCRALRSGDAHDRRASRGLPLLLRGEGPQAPALVAARSARGRPLHAPDDRGHAAADAVLPRPRAAARTTHDDLAEVLPDPGHRRGRPGRPPPDVLRDARKLLVRPSTSRTVRSSTRPSSSRSGSASPGTASG